jgi:ribose transport system permease protein
MTGGSTGAAAPRMPSLTRGGLRRTIRDRPIIPLVILLVVLVAVLELAKPGIVNGGWVATTIRAAIPLAILAACQTLAMLTGGIDLSVGAVASMARSWPSWSPSSPP